MLSCGSWILIFDFAVVSPGSQISSLFCRGILWNLDLEDLFCCGILWILDIEDLFYRESTKHRVLQSFSSILEYTRNILEIY